MKNLKHWIIVAIIAVLGIVVGFTACDNNGTTDQPKDQTATINNLFDKGLSATVNAYLTDPEWAGVAGKIETALNGAYDTAAGGTKSTYEEIFGRGVVFIVEKTTGYNNYKTIGDGKTIYLNYNSLDNQSIILNGVVSIYTNGTSTDGN